MKIYIYIIYFPTSNKYYVGQTNDLEERLLVGHLRRDNDSLLKRALYKYHDWQISILHTVKTRDEANRIEIEEIRNFNSVRPNGYNLTAGGGGVSGFHHSDESIKKMSKIKIGNKYAEGNKGIKLSKEHRKKLSESHQGKKFSKRTKIKMGISNLKFRIKEEEYLKDSDYD